MKREEIKMELVWEVEQSILDAVVQVLDENQLIYSLAYGTLLGAVRHGGFIPWDDDIDIMMPREDYDRFMELWPKIAPQGLVLDRCDMDQENHNTFSKIRKDHTTFLQFERERKEQHHKGVFIDIFPVDRVARGKIARELQYVDFAFMLLFNRGHRSGRAGLAGFVEKVLLGSVPKRKYYKVSQFFGRRSRRWNWDKNAKLVSAATIGECRLYYPANLFEHMQTVRFNGKEYAAFQETDRYLTIQYGDYHKLPPLEDRVWRHPPILIDYSHNYEELSPEEQFR
jgi:lipopolysaccharide cholinephosphotransferase